MPACEGMSIFVFGIVIIFNHIFDLTTTSHGAIIRSIDGAVLILDSDGGFVEANDKAREQFPELIRYKKGERVSEENLKEIFDADNYFEHTNGILLVDDNRVNRRVFCGLLKQTKIKISDVGSGRECLAHVRQRHYDMIFLDHMMPEMDGMETMRLMKEMDVNLCEDTQVIMLTANAIMGAKEQYLSAGFDDFLAKPIDQTKLERLLMHWMPQEKIHSNT